MRRNKDHLPEPYIDIIDNNEPNAYATKSGNKYFIGITSGAIVLIYDTFFRIMSSKKILTDVGDPSKGMEAKKTLNPTLTELGQLTLPKEHHETSAPIDNTRILFAQQLIKMVFEFLIWHEFAHVIFGHVDYVHSVLGSFEIEEIEGEKEPHNWLDALVSQTLEMEADGFATNRGLDILDVLITNPDALTSELRPYLNDWSSAIKMWVFAIYTFFRLFSNQNNVRGIEKASHPVPAVRSILVLATVCTILQPKNDAAFLERVSKICIDAAAAVEGAFEEILQQKLDLTHFSFIMQEEASAHGHFLMKNRNAIIPLLQPFTYAPLRPLST